jgi:hypothetical protein
MSTLLEKITYAFEPSFVKKLEDPLISKNKPETTEFGKHEDSDMLDVDVVSASSYSSLFQLERADDQTLNDLIKRYRTCSRLSYVEMAIDEIVNEAIFKDDMPENPVAIAFNDPEKKLAEKLMDRIIQEFEEILDLTDFDDKGDDYFRQWYIDGRLLVQTKLEKKDLKKGIVGVKIMSPLNLKRIYDKEEKRMYYIYYDPGKTDGSGVLQKDYVIPDELVAFVPSGMYDADKKIPLSYLHSAIKDINRLDTLEDHFLIYRIVRSPERRVFYVDVGNLPPKKAEEYLKQIINTYKQTKIFDPTTGTLVSRNQHPSMLEDFFLLRRNGKGTEIDTLPSAGSLGDIEDLHFFNKKACQALKVPYSRMNTEDRQKNSVTIVTNSEITREELKFSKFVAKLRSKFNVFFFELLRRQLLYKEVIKPNEWPSIKRKLKFIYRTDSQFASAKRLEQEKQRLEILRDMDEFVGKWFTRNDVHKQVFSRTDKEISEFEQRIDEESAKYQDKDETKNKMF